LNRFSKFASMAIISLIAPILSVLPSSAYDPGMVEKTVTVNDAFGLPYGAGATVGFVYLDDAGYSHISPVANTDAQSEAVISIDGSIQYIGIAVAPSSTDEEFALGFFPSQVGNNWNPLGRINAWTQSFEVTLATAETFITPVVGSSGLSLAPAGTGFTVWGTNFGDELYIPRTGKFGINLSNESIGEAYVRLNPNQTGYFPQEQGYDVQESQVLAIGGGEFDEGSQSYVLRMVPANIQGSLVSASGEAITLPAGVKAEVRFVMASSQDTNVPDQLDLAYDGNGTASLASDGSFDGFVSYLPEVGENPIAYIPQVFMTGDANWPSFLGETFWIDESGNTADNAAMAGSQSTLEISIPEISNINLVLNSVRKGTAEADSSSIQIRGDGNPGPWWGNVRSGNGIAAYILPDGQYRMSVDPISSARLPQDFDLGVTGSDIALSYCCEMVYTGDDMGWDWVRVDVASFSSPTEPASFYVSGSLNDDVRIVVTHPITGEPIASDEFDMSVVRWTSANSRFGDSQGVRDTGRGVFSVDLPSLDSYYSASPLVIQIRPRVNISDGLLVTQEYEVAIDPVDLSVSIAKAGEASLSPVASSNDSDSLTFVLSPGYANVYGNLVDTNGDPVGNDWENQSYVYGNAQRFIAEQNRWEGFNNGYVQVKDDGSFGVSLPDGTYRIVFTPQGHDVAETTTPSFTIDGSNPEEVFNDFVMDPPLFSIRIVAPGSDSPLAHAQL
jgi:hypothetical protein